MFVCLYKSIRVISGPKQKGRVAARAQNPFIRVKRRMLVVGTYMGQQTHMQRVVSL